jgi:hypothetical protein
MSVKPEEAHNALSDIKVFFEDEYLIDRLFSA